jgi:hypothetical protein
MIYEGFSEYGVVEFNHLNVSLEESSSEDVAGLVLLTGSVCASAYLVPREPIAQAISDIKVLQLNSAKLYIILYRSCGLC